MIKTTILGMVIAVIIGVGITTVYALPAIQLAGNVKVDGGLEVDGPILSPVINSLESVQGSTCSPSTDFTKLMVIPGIPGESTSTTDPDAIEVFGFCHEITTAVDAASGLPTDKRQHKPLMVVKRIDKSTPLLQKALVNNELLPEMTLKFFRMGPEAGESQQYFTIKLAEARVVSVKAISQDLSNNSDTYPTMEEVSFVYQKITWAYEPDDVEHEDDWKAPTT